MAFDRGVGPHSRLAGSTGWVFAGIFLLGGFLIPVVAIMERGLDGIGGSRGLSLSLIGETLSDGRIWGIVWFTVLQTVLSVGASVLVGVPIAWTVARIEFRGRSLLSSLSALPFVLPTIVVAGAYRAVAPESFVEHHSMWLIVAAHVCFNVGVIVRTVGAAIASIPGQAEEVARSLGRGWARSIWETTLVAVRPQIAASSLIVGIFCLTSFGVIVGLGSPGSTTLEVEIWYQTTRVLNLGVAAVLTTMQLVMVFVMVLVYRAMSGRVRRNQFVPSARRTVQLAGDRAAVAWSVVATGGFVGLPLVALLWASVNGDGGMTLDHYRNLADSDIASNGIAPLDALTNSIAFTTAASVFALLIAVPIALMIAEGRRDSPLIDRMVMLPMGTSAATIGFGFLVAYNRGWLDLRGAWIAVPIVQATVTVPLVVRALVGPLSSLDRSLFEVGASLGAGRRRRQREIWWPIVRKPCAAAAGLAVAVSLGEFGATSFVARSSRPTVPLVIGDLLGRPGASNAGQAMALSCILAGLCALVFVIVDRRGDASVGSFW